MQNSTKHSKITAYYYHSMNSDFHLDKHLRINNQRAAGIVVEDNKILLMHRIYKGVEYYVFPGGHLQKNEKLADAAIREIQEETTIVVNNPILVFEFRNYKKDNYDFYFTCDYVSGNPTLGGEEALKNNTENFYEPMWVDFSKIAELNILPKFAKEWVEETIIKQL